MASEFAKYLAATGPDWIAAISALLAAIAAFGAGTAAWLQLRATKEQTRAALFSEKYAAYAEFKVHVRKALLDGGDIGDAQAAQESAQKLRFLFSAPLMERVDAAVKLSWSVLDERQQSFNADGKRDGNPHYDANVGGSEAARRRTQRTGCSFP